MKSWLLEGFRWALLPVVVMGVMALFRKAFPVESLKRTLSEDELSELDDRFIPFRGQIIGGMILIGIIFCFGTWVALSSVNLFLASLDGPAVFRFFPQKAIWWFFPAVGALSLCWEITLQIGTLFSDRATVNLFSDWTNQTSAFWGSASYPGMDSRRVLRWLALLVALPIGVFTVLALNMHATVGNYSIHDCGYASRPCDIYHLADVQRITQIQGFRTRDGKLTKRAGIVLDFSDGRRWSSAAWSDFRETADPNLANFLIGRTGLPMDLAVTEDDIPPLPPSAQPAPKLLAK